MNIFAGVATRKNVLALQFDQISVAGIVLLVSGFVSAEMVRILGIVFGLSPVDLWNALVVSRSLWSSSR